MKKKAIALALFAALLCGFALPAMAAEGELTVSSYSVAGSKELVSVPLSDLTGEAPSYPAMTVSINEVGQAVSAPDKTARVTVSGGSGSFSYQWYYAKSMKEGGAVSSPAKGSRISGQTGAEFAIPASAESAGRYLYCQVTDTVTGEKAYSAGRKLLLLPPVKSGGAPQAAAICYNEVTFALPDTYGSSHPYATDKFGAAAVKEKKITLEKGGSVAAKLKSASYSSKTNTFKLTFDGDVSAISQPFQICMRPAKYAELALQLSGITPTKEPVALSKTSASLVMGKTVTLTAKPSAASWSSSNPAVATVSSKGVVTGVSMGTAVITVTSSRGGTAECAVTVADALRPAQIGGGGSVQLQLSTTSKYACFKLYHAGSTKGTPVRLLFLNPNTSGSMSFDPGTYVLKIASGKAWLGDDQAFGKSGSYSQSEAYEFTPGSYSIVTSTVDGDFRSSSMGGFVG